MHGQGQQLQTRDLVVALHPIEVHALVVAQRNAVGP